MKRLTLCVALLAAGANLEAAPKTTKAKQFDPNQELGRLYQLYTMRAMGKQAVWESIEELSRYEGSMTANKQTGLAQMKSDLLNDAGYPVIAATYAADAIKREKDPLNKYMRSTWQLLWKVSRTKPIQFILEDIARTTNLPTNPPFFGNDWNYITANAYAADGKDKLALEYYKKIRLGDRYFMPAQYQIAMISLAGKEDQKAELALKSILYQNTRDASPLAYADKVEMWNYANMALGRLYYQNRQFLRATQHYRKVTRNSPLFYDALFEQSWSLFMGGHPLHSLGTLYGVASPQFKENFNPESKVLEAINYYWMCRYEDSRNALADFADTYTKVMEGLDSYLERQQLTPDTTYQLFEHYVADVSSESLGLPRNVIATVASRDTLLLLRDQLATVMEEQDRLSDKGVFGSKKGDAVPAQRIENIAGRIKNALGTQLIVELKAEKEHYDDLYSQSQFLYVELLMSEKEQLLGRELHSSTKLTKGLSDNIRGWARNTQSWKSGSGEEFWSDEIGYHIINVEPKCNKK